MNRHDGGVDLSRLTLLELVVSLREGEVSPVDAASFFLDRIDALDGLGAFVETTRERALEQASALGSVRDGAPALWGVPMADKDLVARAGVPTRYGSRAFEGFVPAASDPLAEALDRLGSVSLGKTRRPARADPAGERRSRSRWACFPRRPPPTRAVPSGFPPRPSASSG
jgi:amidase